MGLDEKLTKFLAERGWTAKQLAAAVGTSGASVGRWLNDGTRPTSEHMHGLARVMRVPIEYLTDDSLDAPPMPELTDDERYLVLLIRDSKLSREDVAQAILALTRQAPKEYQRAGQVDRQPSSAQDAQGQDERTDAPRVPRRAR